MVQWMSSEVVDQAGLEQAIAADFELWARDGQVDQVVEIKMQVVSGQRFIRETHLRLMG